MGVLLLTGVFLVFFLVAVDRQPDLREAVLWALLGFALAILCLTETLGLFGWLNAAAVAAAGR